MLEFGWINLFGAVIVTVMLIPNIVYALRTKDSVNKCKSRIMNLTEQIGRYGCMTLMWLPLLVWKFGFLNVEEMLVYVVGNLGLTVAYIIIWIPYFKRKTLGKAIALAVIPTCIFLLSGLLLRHWLLVLATLLFGMGHIYITYQNHADLK